MSKGDLFERMQTKFIDDPYFWEVCDKINAVPVDDSQSKKGKEFINATKICIKDIPKLLELCREVQIRRLQKEENGHEKSHNIDRIQNVVQGEKTQKRTLTGPKLDALKGGNEKSKSIISEADLKIAKEQVSEVRDGIMHGIGLFDDPIITENTTIGTRGKEGEILTTERGEIPTQNRRVEAEEIEFLRSLFGDEIVNKREKKKEKKGKDYKNYVDRLVTDANEKVSGDEYER